MAKRPENHGKPWTDTDRRELGDRAKKNTPTGLINRRFRSYGECGL
ncbi:MAG: hypothetical protein LBP22_11685 [Deltaproteobacteria bacterium]|jgi:hypothetical protein|nr:hypothetical protein [Deltaproteobacteria bacterium]